jgi:hypothetical protein
MRTYRMVWRVACGALALVGAGVTFSMSPPTLAFLFFTFAVLCGMLPPSTRKDYHDHSFQDRARLITSFALVGGTTAGAFVGFAVQLGVGALLLVLLVVVSCPYALSACARWFSTSAPSAAQIDALTRGLAYSSPGYIPLPAPSAPSELATLTDEQLCQGWRSSFLTLQEQSSGPRLLAAVANRQRYLDEFERRCPRGFAAWLASGARAPGDPLPYLTGARVDNPSINWDDLTRGQDH